MFSTKEEKSLSQQALPSIETLYKTVHNLHNEWGMDFYRVTPKYFDPLKDKQNKINPKQNIRIKHGKRGHFLDEIAKQSCTPAPNKYNTSPGWEVGGKLKNPRVLVDRNYAQQIMFQQKKHKSPAPNAYNVVPTTQQTQAKLRKIKERKAPIGSDRLSFLNTVQYQSLNSPGPGNYNPHKIIKSQKQNHFTPQQMIQKNKQRQKKLKQRFSKSTGFNYNPVVKNSFAQRQLFPKHYTENNATIYKKDWKPKKTLSKSVCIVPGSNYYKVTQDWTSKSGIFKSLSNYKSNVSVYR